MSGIAQVAPPSCNAHLRTIDQKKKNKEKREGKRRGPTFDAAIMNLFQFLEQGIVLTYFCYFIFYFCFFGSGFHHSDYEIELYPLTYLHLRKLNIIL